MDIRYLKGKEIEKVKWNSCVHYAGNGNIFGYHWYLNHVAKDWDCLVEDDYASVFPLVWRQGWFGHRALYQPRLMRAMGVYSIHVLSQARLRAFLEAIPPSFRQLDIVLNEQNRPPEDLDFDIQRLTNHQLLLNQPFEVLEENFTPDLKDKIAQAEGRGLLATTSLKPETIAAFYRQHAKDRNKEEKVHTLQRIMYNVLHRGWGYAAGIQDAGGDLLAVNFYMYSHGKVTSLVPVESAEGSRQGALSYLLHMLVRSHATRPLVLDFNTSADDALARSFGALPNPYFRLRRDRRVLGLF